jgi:hypothetical protein
MTTKPREIPVRQLGLLLAAALVLTAWSATPARAAETQTIPATADTWARQNSEQNSAHGGQASVRVRGGAGIDENRAYVAFDLARLSVPAGSTNITARLLLRVQRYDYTGQPVNTSFVRKTTSGWTESTLTWANQPATATTEQPVSLRAPAGSDATADVTPLLPSTLTGTLGLRLAEHYTGWGGTTNGQQVSWATKEDTTGPAARLEVRYTLPKGTIAAAYRAQVASQQGAWYNINGSPIWHSGATPCREPVRNIKASVTGGEYKALSDKWASVPFPCGFTATVGSPDHEVILINDNPAAGEPDYFEFWQLRDGCRYTDGTETPGRTPDAAKTTLFCGFMADWGGADARTNMLKLWPLVDTWRPGGSDPQRCTSPGGVCWGTRGSGVAFLPGLITVRDLYDGEITHPVQITVASACSTWVAPATRADGADTANCIPYGSIIKLPASASCTGYVYVARLVCEAGKKYGLIAVDQNHDKVSFAFEGYTHPNAWWRPAKGVFNPYATPPYRLKRDCADPAKPWAIRNEDGAAVECFPDDTDPAVPAASASTEAINRVKALTPSAGPGHLNFFGCDGLQGTSDRALKYRTTGYPVQAGEWDQDCVMGLRWSDLLNRTDWYDANG